MSGSSTRWMERVFSSGQMVGYTEDNTNMTKRKLKGRSLGTMAGNMWVNGTMESSMVREPTSHQMVRRRRESGRTANVCGGLTD